MRELHPVVEEGLGSGITGCNGETAAAIAFHEHRGLRRSGIRVAHVHGILRRRRNSEQSGACREPDHLHECPQLSPASMLTSPDGVATVRLAAAQHGIYIGFK